MKLGIDLDGVLFPFDQNFKDYCLKIGENIPHDTKTESWDFFKEWGMSSERFIEICNQGVDDQFIFLEADPYPNSVEALQGLKNDGHTIHVITHRMFGSKSAHNTFDWLYKHDVPFESVTFAEDKTSVQVDLLLEDNVDNCRASIDAGIACVLYDRPWNQTDEFKRVYRWRQYSWIVNVLQKYLTNASENTVS